MGFVSNFLLFVLGLTVFLTQVSFYTFIGTLASSMMASALPEIAQHYGMMHTFFLGFAMLIFSSHHEFFNYVHDTLNFLSLICTWAPI